MKNLLQLLCCLFISLLVLDMCGEARQSPFISGKDSSALHENKSHHLEESTFDSATGLGVSHPKKAEVSKNTISELTGGGGGTDPKWKKIGRNLMEEEFELGLGREMIEHIDYAGATTHPPSEPPKKKKTSSKQKSLHPPSRAR